MQIAVRFLERIPLHVVPTARYLFPINTRHLFNLKNGFVALKSIWSSPLEEQMSRFEKQREPSRSLKTWIGGFRVPGLVAQHNAKPMNPPATFANPKRDLSQRRETGS
jgi:hypothetical protein